MKKQILLFILMILPMVASADKSGSCGTNVTYTYVESTHTLTISGTGDMSNYTYGYYIVKSPWYNYRLEIAKAVIEDGVTSIGNYAFYGCSGLTSVTIPNSVRSVGDKAFDDCIGLTSVTLACEYVGSWFQGRQDLKEVILKDGVTSIEEGAFNGTGWYENQNDGILYLDNWVLGYKGNKPIGQLNIINGTIGIAIQAFSECTGLTSVTIPNSVTSIGYGAFLGCSGLTSVSIGSGVTSIGQSVFSGCSGLTSVTIPNSVTSIGWSAFQGCDISSINIPNSVTDIGYFAFRRTKWLENQPDGLVYAGSVLYGYKGEMPDNTHVDVKEGIVCINDFAFSGCIGLTSITIPSSVRAIDWSAFSGCINLTSVTIPDGMTYIDERAFSGCSGLTSVTIGSSVTTIGESAFSGCSGLTSVTIPNSVTSIGYWAFSGCSGLTSVTIPNSVTSIGDYAFQNCSGLTSITIPNSVTSIDYGAFSGCSGLTSVTIYAPSLVFYGSAAFLQNGQGRKIYVFKDCLSTYRSGWSDYSGDIEAIPDLTVNDAGGELGYWCTYYNGLSDVMVPNGTMVYTAKVNGNNVELTETGSQIIKRGEAVLLKSAVAIELNSAASSGSGDYTDNELHGVDVATPQTAGKTYYVLSKKNGVFGFYKLADGVNLAANKAYLVIPSNASSRDFLGFDEATAIRDASRLYDKGNMRNDFYYDLSGRKIYSKPMKGGMYIHNGRKEVLK